MAVSRSTGAMPAESVTLRTFRWIIPATVAMVGLIAGLQAFLPFGWSLCGLYVIPIALAALWSSFRHAFLVGAVTMVSTVVSTLTFFSSPFWDSGMTLLHAYLIPMAAMWWIAILALMRKWAERKTHRAKQHRLICTVCKCVWSTEGAMSLEQYGQRHQGGMLAVGMCGGCTAKWGALSPGPFHVSTR